MSDQDNIKKLIEIHQRRLQKLKEQQGQFGVHTPPYITTEIEDAEAEIERLRKELAGGEPPPPSPAGSKQEPPMSGIPAHLSNRLREALADCEQFETHRSLRSLFAHELLKPWRNSLPQADTMMGRVDATISFLHDKRRRDGANALVLLLRVLSGQLDPEDERHHQLAELADALDRSLGGTPTTYQRSSPSRPAEPGGTAQPPATEAPSPQLDGQPPADVAPDQTGSEMDQEAEETKPIDFFISYNRHDRQWAEWAAWQLEAAGYSTIIQAWDFRPGGNFVADMQRATAQAERTIAVLSPDYLASHFTRPEWNAAFAQDPTGEKGLLVPVRVRECKLEGLLPQIVYIDLVGLDQERAKRELLAGVKRGRAKPSTEPGFPGEGSSDQPDFPG
jgi:hypothetical protein